jgi:hypothetical protein
MVIVSNFRRANLHIFGGILVLRQLLTYLLNLPVSYVFICIYLMDVIDNLLILSITKYPFAFTLGFCTLCISLHISLRMLSYPLLKSLMTSVVSLRFHLLTIDRWLERADESEPIPALSAVASERTESPIEAVELQNEARLPHSVPIESFQTRFNPQNIASPDITFSGHSITSTALTPDISRRFLSLEETSTPTPIPSRKRPRFTPINQSHRLSATTILPVESVEQFSSRSPDFKPSTSRTPLNDAKPVNDVTILPTSTLPDRLRSLFPYDYFNAMQSEAFHSIYASDHNIVLSAPTGSGKTACFEIAIARLMNADPLSTQKFKVC